MAQLAAIDAGIDFLGDPNWGRGGLHASLVQPIELGILTCGFVGSLVIGVHLARRDTDSQLSSLPWIGLYVTLYSAAVWLLSQPMEMRGTFL